MVTPRAAVPTVTFVDEYCAAYSHLFPEVRTFENFKYLHVGMISDIKRKSLPEIALIRRFIRCTTITKLSHRLPLVSE